MKKLYSIIEYRKLFIATALQRVAEVFFKYPDKEFSLSDIAKEAGVAKANTGKILENLEKSGFILIEKLAKIWRIRANRSSQHYLRSKIVYNLNFAYQSGLVEFLAKEYNNPKSIILFGSFRKGEDVSSSDIDIAIEKEETKEYKTLFLKELADYEKFIRRRIQLHEFNRKIVDIHIFNNIANGIVLYGFLEVKK